MTDLTSRRGVSPLRFRAEYGSVRSARVLLDSGADVNARADYDREGIGGHTAVFHIHNYCRPVIGVLIEAGADFGIDGKALVWEESMSWESVLFEVNPISYARCGLYQQFHRREEHIYSNIEYLYRKHYARWAPLRNVPNKYLAGGHGLLACGVQEGCPGFGKLAMSS